VLVTSPSYANQSQRWPSVIWLVVAAALALSTSRITAQCPSGSAPDALGCAIAPGSSSQPDPASITIQESSQVGVPKADNATDAGGLSNGTPRAEAAVGVANDLRKTLPIQPEPPTEFQRFVTASTGETLAIYGAKLFSSHPVSFGSLDHGPAPGELIIGTDDELRIRVWGQVNFSANLRVSREGDVYLPKIGAIHVAGLPFSAVRGQLRSVMERVYRNFEMSVDMGEIHSIQIYVTGLAHRPGEYTVSALSSLIDAVFSSGGPAAAGSMRHVLLKRSGAVVTDFDLYALLVNGEKTGDVQLQPGDVLYIPSAGPQVALLGSVREAGIYELRGRESIDNLLDQAGGKSTIASGGELSLERIEDHARRRAFEVASDPAGLATLLADGDILRVNPIISTYHDSVTLRGAVANPGHFKWHEGMHLSELLPDRDAILKRDYRWLRTKLGIPSPEFSQPGTTLPREEITPAVESPAAQTNWNYAVIERLAPSTMTTSLLPFNLGKLVLDHDVSQDLNLMPGDVVTVFSQEDIRIPIHEQTKYVTLEGEFVHPGVYSAAASETLRSVVERAGGLTGQAYPYGAVFTRKSTQVLEQEHLKEAADQLEHQMMRNSMGSVGGVNSAAGQQAELMNRGLIGRIRNVHASGRIVLDMRPSKGEGYELPGMRLEDGDRLVVPFTPETVQVLGAVFNPQAFRFHQGATVGEYLRIAGSPSRDADRKRIFVLAADGTVTSRESASSVFKNGLNKLHLHPGDSVIVPEKPLHPSAVSQALAWTQAISQSSTTALEVNALK
jgi:polysaccharide biosynthesis/export protein